MPINAARKRELYAQRVASGKCIKCPKAATTGHRYCAAHVVKRRILARNWAAKNRAICVESTKRNRIKRRAAGICRECVKPRSPGSSAFCAEHRQYQTTWVSQYRWKKGAPKRAYKAKVKDNKTLARLKSEPLLGSNWHEAEEWIKAHMDVFTETSDRILGGAIELDVNRMHV